MGDLTRAQFRAEVESNLGGRSDLGSGGGLNTFNRALDRVQTRIKRANTQGWAELKTLSSDTLTASQAAYDSTDGLETNIDKIMSLYITPTGRTSSYRLTSMLKSQWDSQIGDPSIRPENDPVYYIEDRAVASGDTVQSRRIRWYPVPAVGTITLWKVLLLKPTVFSSDASVSDFEDKDDVILALLTSYMFSRYQAFEEAKEWFQMYRGQLQDALIDDKNKPDAHAIPRSLGLMGSNVTQVNSWQDPFVKSNTGRAW